MFKGPYNQICFLFFLLTGLALYGCQPDQQENANALIHETSPYLLQHVHNPVNWYPWGEQALKKAREQNKLMIISVGYAACHWCHVMEEESFEDTTVAAMMNDHFISIKVDREERPDIDQIYMEAAQLANGRGGWPLNAIALPDGRPVFAGSYFPKEDWLRIIRQMAELYQQSPERLELVAEQLTKGIQSESLVNNVNDTTALSSSDADQYFSNWSGKLDLEQGGTKGTPKFPITAKQHFLMQYYFHTGHDTAHEALVKSLDAMAMGGIYDHLGGGFARYATDVGWKIPHFEKMLYDNTMLVSLYCDAYRLTGYSRYARVVRETLRFLQTEMYHQAGGFYSSLDADSEGEEGAYYVWTSEELNNILAEDAATFREVYHITPEGNWEEGKNVLHTSLEQLQSADENLLNRSKQKLLQVRNDRERPATDDKVITAWNALAVKAFVDAYQALGEEKWLEQAQKTAQFLDENMVDEDGQIYRTYYDGQVKINGFLDEYALLIQAYISLYEVSFEITWLVKARQLTDYVLSNFSDENEALLFYTSQTQPSLIARKNQVQDNVIPSSNAIMAENLMILGELFYHEPYLRKSKAMIQRVKTDMLQYPDAFSYWALVMLRYAYPPYEVAIVGPDYRTKRREFDQYYFPDVIFLGGGDDKDLPLLENKLVQGKTFIYVCQDKLCKLPVQNISNALKQLPTVPN